MIRKTTNAKTPGAESGAALLIAIFALLLISVVAIALLVSTSTDTALAGNYRSATGVYYAGLAGIEEGRGRMLWKNPNFINLSTSPPFSPMAGSRRCRGITCFILLIRRTGKRSTRRI